MTKLDDYKKAIANEVVEKCSSMTDSGDSAGHAKICSNTTSKILMCITRELFLSCPTEQRDQSVYCIELREKVQNSKRTPVELLM